MWVVLYRLSLIAASFSLQMCVDNTGSNKQSLCWMCDFLMGYDLVEKNGCRKFHAKMFTILEFRLNLLNGLDCKTSCSQSNNFYNYKHKLFTQM